jgi:thiol-disulfide isomerase/thioredoxin
MRDVSLKLKAYNPNMRKSVIIILVLVIATASFSQSIKKIKVTELEKTIRESRTPLIVSFWATFCVPCIQEIPYLERLVKQHEKDSIKLLLVSLDMQQDYVKIRPLASKKKFISPIVWLNETNADYFCPKVDSSWSGAIPATLFINNKTGYRKFYEEQVKEAQLEKEIMAILGSR